jgi:uncharacterized protein YpuA (DUF1002 family)
VFIQSKKFNQWAPIYKKIVVTLYDEFKDSTSDDDKQKLLDIVKDICSSGPQEAFDIIHPVNGNVVCTLYTPEDKSVASDVLKNLGGNINYNPVKFNVKRKNNSQEYKDAWNKIIKQLDTRVFDDDTLKQIADAINKA